MGNMAFLEAAIEKKLMEMHCAYLGRVTGTDGETATVQPLGLMKEAGGAQARAQAVVSGVPVACRYKISVQTITYLAPGDGRSESRKVAVPREIEKGDLVVCLCADRDIAGALRGENVLPPAGRHNISDSIIVGIL